jgi:hypothetical protein
VVLGDTFNASVPGLLDALDTDKEAAVAAPVDDHFSGFGKDDPVGFPHVIYRTPLIRISVLIIAHMETAKIEPRRLI